MKRKRLIHLPAPADVSVADALVIIQQTIGVTMMLQKGIDPNDAYNEWEANKENILACSQVIQAILETVGKELSVIDFSFPEGISLGGYRVEDLDIFGSKDNLPF